NSIAVSNDHIAVGTATSVLIYDIHLQLIQELKNPADLAVDLAWSSDGTQLAVAYSDGLFDIQDSTIEIWDIATANIILTILAEVNNIAWSGDLLAASLGEGYSFAYVWDTDDGQLVSSLSSANYNISEITWSLHGQRLALAGSDLENNLTLQFWDPRQELNPTVATTIPDRILSDLDWVFGDSMIAIGTASGLVFWDIKSQTIQYIDGLPDGVTSVSNAPSNHQLAIGNSYGEIYIWDKQTNALISETIHSDDVLDIIWSSQSENTIYSLSTDETLSRWTFSEIPEIIAIDIRGTPSHMAWSLDGDSIAIIYFREDEDALLSIWNLNENTVVDFYDLGSSIHFPVWSNDGQRIAMSVEGILYILDTGTAQIVTTDLPGVPLAWSPNDHWLAINSSAAIFIVETTTGSVDHIIQPQGRLVDNLAVWNETGLRWIVHQEDAMIDVRDNISD
ncbi:MAG: hypothetical protein SAK29_43055, partial [Scytonema sp. PMC 1069.18]|nr:hypothetical protein [Scytonema sp. PMC 1069.18]